MSTLKPFASASSTTIGGLTVEGDEDKLVLSGSLEIAIDRKGLADVESLIAVLQSARASLQARPLPERAEGDLPPGPRIHNPF